jgi:hypothetical protein
VATGLNPVGEFLHAFGSGTTYNPFFRELATATFSPGPSIADTDETHYLLGGLAIGASFPILYEIGETQTPHELTPIATEGSALRYGPDLAVQLLGASAVTYFASLDANGALALDYYVVNSSGGSWQEPIKLPAPSGTFSFSPTVCTENGSFGSVSVNLVAAAGGQLWFAKTASVLDGFPSWTPIAGEPASAPDCAIAGGTESIVHVVTLSAAGAVLDINGKGTTWVVTDLGPPP